MYRCELVGGLHFDCCSSVFDTERLDWAESGLPGRLHATCSAVARRMGSALSRAWFVRSEAWYSSLDCSFASPVATADSVAPADFGRHPKAPPGREKGRDDRPRPHSPGWPSCLPPNNQLPTSVSSPTRVSHPYPLAGRFGSARDRFWHSSALSGLPVNHVYAESRLYTLSLGYRVASALVCKTACAHGMVPARR